jgi:hypothetical protein
MVHSTEVVVSQEDIDAALRKDSSRCVVATAIAREFPKASRIIVDVHSIKFTDGARRYTYLTPPRVMDYIVAFDAGDVLHPFKFRLRTDQRLIQQRRAATPEGLALNRARNRARDRKTKLEQVSADPTASPAKIEVASDEYAAAVAEVDAVKAATGAVIPPGKTRARSPKPLRPVEDMSDVPAEEVKPVSNGRTTVFYRNHREYGQRAMRVNQHDDAPGDFRGPLDIDA